MDAPPPFPESAPASPPDAPKASRGPFLGEIAIAIAVVAVLAGVVGDCLR